MQCSFLRRYSLDVALSERLVSLLPIHPIPSHRYAIPACMFGSLQLTLFQEYVPTVFDNYSYVACDLQTE
jgi:hypothetical protein